MRAIAVLLGLLVLAVFMLVAALAVPRFHFSQSRQSHDSGRNTYPVPSSQPERSEEFPSHPEWSQETYSRSDWSRKRSFHVASGVSTIALPILLVAGVVWIIRKLKERSPEPDASIGPGLGKLLKNIDRLEDRIGNIETIMMDRRER